MPLTYLIISFCAQFIPKKTDNKLIICIGLSLCAIGSVFMGPSQFFHLPDYLWIQCVGLTVNGLGLGLLVIPTLPEMVAEAKRLFPQQQTQVGSIVSGFFNSFLGLGSMLGPMFGANFYDYFGFKVTMDFQVLLVIIVIAIMIVMGGAYTCFLPEKYRR